MNRQEKIEAIYEKIARKDLNFGCRIKVLNYYWGSDDYDILDGYDVYIDEDGADIRVLENDTIDKSYNCGNGGLGYGGVIGHPVMIGDVMDYIENNGFEDDFEKIYGVEYTPVGKINLPNNLFNIWDEKRKPIDEQSDECVDFIFNNLLKNGKLKI